jgi:hypothetical protein
MAPQLARAETSATPTMQSDASVSTCGKTIDEKLAAAKRLQPNDAATRAALACLIEATIAIKQTIRSCDAEHSQYGLLHVVPRDEPFTPPPK